MTLEELKQVKADFDNGIMVSRATWARVLDVAIKAEKSDSYTIPIVTGYAEKLHPMPSQVWRPELTEEQKEDLKKQVAEGVIPF